MPSCRFLSLRLRFVSDVPSGRRSALGIFANSRRVGCVTKWPSSQTAIAREDDEDSSQEPVAPVT